ncbi:uncharacterized protein V6R79_006660 [Siganus canaliculatus]
MNPPRFTLNSTCVPAFSCRTRTWTLNMSTDDFTKVLSTFNVKKTVLIESCSRRGSGFDQVLQVQPIRSLVSCSRCPGRDQLGPGPDWGLWTRVFRNEGKSRQMSWMKLQKPEKKLWILFGGGLMKPNMALNPHPGLD